MTDGASGERARSRPAERMAGPEQLLDVPQALAALRAESHPATRGHRQITLVHREGLRVLLLAFEPGAGLPDHAVPAPAAIHGVEGTVVIRSGAATHRVGVGQVLVLDAGVRHDVVAEGAAAILIVLAMAPAVNAGGAPPAASA
jgi:quercetin dioxygenase-like cupin family protein